MENIGDKTKILGLWQGILPERSMDYLAKAKVKRRPGLQRNNITSPVGGDGNNPLSANKVLPKVGRFYAK